MTGPADLAAVLLGWGCPLKAVTGIPCPLCGGTRACEALVRLDVWGALAMNPGVVVVGALYVAYLAWGFGRQRATGGWPALPDWAGWRWVATGAVAANWAYVILVGR